MFFFIVSLLQIFCFVFCFTVAVIQSTVFHSILLLWIISGICLTRCIVKGSYTDISNRYRQTERERERLKEWRFENIAKKHKENIQSEGKRNGSNINDFERQKIRNPFNRLDSSIGGFHDVKNVKTENHIKCGNNY